MMAGGEGERFGGKMWERAMPATVPTRTLLSRAWRAKLFGMHHREQRP